MKGLFDTLLNKIRPIVSARPRVLAAHFPPDGLLYHYSQYNLLESSTLHIDAGQVAYLIINEQYTPAYREGEYPLDPDNIPQTETADILFLNTVAIANRLWQSAYQPSQRPLDQPLSGTYSVSIYDADAVCRTVIEHQAINLDDELIDQWVSYTIDHTLINEHISADDIENQAEALQNFLKARLRTQLNAQGLTLHDLRIGRRPPAAKTERERRAAYTETPVFAPARENAAPAATIAVANSATVSDTPRSPLSEDKIYYRVHHGQQIGPLSALDIQKLIDEGQILARDLLWQKGMTAWLPAQAFSHFNWN